MYCTYTDKFDSGSSLKILYFPDVDEGKKSSSQEMMANDSVLSTDVATSVFIGALVSWSRKDLNFFRQGCVELWQLLGVSMKFHSTEIDNCQIRHEACFKYLQRKMPIINSGF